jgi:hypothetical protein
MKHADIPTFTVRTLENMGVCTGNCFRNMVFVFKLVSIDQLNKLNLGSSDPWLDKKLHHLGRRGLLVDTGCLLPARYAHTRLDPILLTSSSVFVLILPDMLAPFISMPQAIDKKRDSLPRCFRFFYICVVTRGTNIEVIQAFRTHDFALIISPVLETIGLSFGKRCCTPSKTKNHLAHRRRFPFELSRTWT